MTSCWVKVPFMRSLVICIGVSSQKGGHCGGGVCVCVCVCVYIYIYIYIYTHIRI